jgi:hypothetical protein
MKPKKTPTKLSGMITKLNVEITNDAIAIGLVGARLAAVALGLASASSVSAWGGRFESTRVQGTV